MRACKSSREEAAKAQQVSIKLRQIEAMIFFISVSFPIHGLPARGRLSFKLKQCFPVPRATRPAKFEEAGGNLLAQHRYFLNQPTASEHYRDKTCHVRNLLGYTGPQRRNRQAQPTCGAHRSELLALQGQMQHFTSGMDVGGGPKKAMQIRSRQKTVKIKKRGVPRRHENMLPGNSFPQICVVSVNSIVDNVMSAQEYLKVVA